mmetsp:Transcript_28950/g.69893  ORF Transcript_28950/g.69893 Transcript_28950/m.69893 type:complete len:137 (-) Transcript_28950:588-998(-)
MKISKPAQTKKHFGTPSNGPTSALSNAQSNKPSSSPSHAPSNEPSRQASASPSTAPSASPTLPFHGQSVQISGDWENPNVAVDDPGRYFLFHPGHWEAVFGSLPVIGPVGIYDVEQRQNSEVVWQGAVDIWNMGCS